MGAQAAGPSHALSGGALSGEALATERPEWPPFHRRLRDVAGVGGRGGLNRAATGTAGHLACDGTALQAEAAGRGASAADTLPAITAVIANNAHRQIQPTTRQRR